MEQLSRKQIEMANVKEYLSLVKQVKILTDDIKLIINPWTDEFATRYLKISSYREQLLTPEEMYLKNKVKSEVCS